MWDGDVERRWEGGGRFWRSLLLWLWALGILMWLLRDCRIDRGYKWGSGWFLWRWVVRWWGIVVGGGGWGRMGGVSEGILVCCCWSTFWSNTSKPTIVRAKHNAEKIRRRGTLQLYLVINWIKMAWIWYQNEQKGKNQPPKINHFATNPSSSPPPPPYTPLNPPKQTPAPYPLTTIPSRAMSAVPKYLKLSMFDMQTTITSPTTPLSLNTNHHNLQDQPHPSIIGIITSNIIRYSILEQRRGIEKLDLVGVTTQDGNRRPPTFSRPLPSPIQ